MRRNCGADVQQELIVIAFALGALEVERVFDGDCHLTGDLFEQFCISSRKCCFTQTPNVDCACVLAVLWCPRRKLRDR